MTTTLTLTDAQITQAFEDWETDYRANPASFMTAEEVAAMEVATCAERGMLAFKAYVRQRSGGHDLVPGQPLQPLTVSMPIGIAVSGDATVVVQVYEIGRGITIVSEQGHLLCREGTLELEAAGVRLVIDPLASETAQGLVLPVERDVGAIGQPLQTVNQEQAAEFALSKSGHGGVFSLKTAILALPAGFGKSGIAIEMAAWLGCSHVVDEWHWGKPLEGGALHLTNARLKGGAA